MIKKRIEFTDRNFHYDIECDVRDVDTIIKRIRMLCATPRQAEEVQAWFDKYHKTATVKVTVRDYSNRVMN